MNPPSRLKKWLIRLAFAAICLVTIVALCVAEEDWRGNYEWNHYKHSLEAKGERFGIAQCIPAPVPDDQNLANLPFFKRQESAHLPNNVKLPNHAEWQFDAGAELTNWAAAYGNPTPNPTQAAATVLSELDRREPFIAQFEEGGERPYCRFNIDYENWMGNTNTQISTVTQLIRIKGLVRVLALRSEAELLVGKSEGALHDLRTILRVIAGVRQEPLLISQLVGYATLTIALQPVAQGLAAHQWTDAQLHELEQQLARIDLLKDAQDAFVGERNICDNPYFNDNRIVISGWTRLEQLNLNRAVEETLFPRIDVAAHRIDPAISDKCDLLFTNMTQHPYLRHCILLKMSASVPSRVCEKTAVCQSEVDEVRVACALERYRLAEGHYPETLPMLVPGFAASLPNDVISGQPLKYRLLNDGKYILYSIGWNNVDDGGVAATTEGGHFDALHGDWTFSP